SKVEPVCELPIAGPFAVGAEIGNRTLDLDDDEIARLAERQDVGAAPVGQGEFDEAGITELRQRPADAARQQQGRTGLAGSAHARRSKRNAGRPYRQPQRRVESDGDRIWSCPSALSCGSPGISP